jgi:hypothetical protein
VQVCTQTIGLVSCQCKCEPRPIGLVSCQFTPIYNVPITTITTTTSITTWTDKTLAIALFGTTFARRGAKGDLAESLGDAFIDTFGAMELEHAKSIDNLPPARRAQGRDEANNAGEDGDTGSADWMDTA